MRHLAACGLNRSRNRSLGFRPFGRTSNVVRSFCDDAHFNNGINACIYVDASPFGLGAWLSVDSKPVEYFADIFSDTDCVMLRVEQNIGSKGQQAFEALALLVALRLWITAF